MYPGPQRHYSSALQLGPTILLPGLQWGAVGRQLMGLSHRLAANPGCALEDFVRWYSPRDYVEEEVVDEMGATVHQGELSARMKIPGNMWAEAWETARCVPARRQKRLFDDTKEAEKLKEEESVEDIPSARSAIQQATSHASKQLRHPSPDHKKLEEVIGQLVAVETVIACARSLKAKFGIGKAEAGEDSDDLENIIHKLFVSAQRAALLAPLDDDLVRPTGGGAEDRKPMGGGLNVPDFPPPAGREILLRTCVPRPAPYSKALPQRLFCVLMREDFRLGGAFSSDTSFF
ncbi:hypothetical protein CRUP_037755 [Coryphaenoides rupestris]|nr:hypothetical protein CRUP_037755 [Coryphaenoides rupestris]